ncbi:MAG: type II toxin-antitoxin system RelB/DinJ family antitoxin [Lachnospiraceae bacterium]|nr:type II toxin-antitoxin system RelB/DinJ family antitoxin [Lachnospiraceae bacterium]
MSMEAVVQIRMDKDLKDATEKLYKELGTSFAEAVRIFAKKSIDEQAMPFSIKKIKTHKSYGILKKYANAEIMKNEKSIIGDAIVEKYVKNN